MAKKANKLTVTPQSYPRITDEDSNFKGYLDYEKLVPHQYKIPPEKLKELITSAIKTANMKSSRTILSIPKDTTDEEKEKLFVKKGKELFSYFKKYCKDPASAAYDIYNRHYKDVCITEFNNRTLQKERMNSGWRYQYLARDCAREVKRFKSLSDIGASESDLNVIIDFIDKDVEPLSLYVSIKNRQNTLGGQDWPKAITSLEEIAINDKNRTGYYCCVFGITMDRGTRNIKTEKKSGIPYSYNTEVWLSDFFWPFFANYTYEEIMKFVLNTLLESEEPKVILDIHLPELLIETFGNCCRKRGLINDQGKFNDPIKLVEFFCQK